MGSFVPHGWASALLAFAIAWFAQTASAGANRPSYIDGCRSVNGRYEIVAEAKSLGPTTNGPHTWDFIWKDTQTGATHRMPAQGIQGGLIFGQLFISPDGETFALWNHIVQYWPDKSENTDPALPAFEQVGEEEKFRGHDIHKKRLIIFRKDGSILKEFGAADFLTAEEWGSVKQVFTMIEWLAPYDGMDKKTPYRVQYSFYRVSPDYTVLEFQPVRPKKATGKQRVVRVSLTDGRVFGPDEEITDPAKIPVRPFIGENSLPKRNGAWWSSYVPSLDPVRTAGAFRIVSLAEAYPVAKAQPVKPVTFGEVKLLASGYQQADTPSFVEKFAGRNNPSLLFADNKRKQLFRCGLENEAAAELISSEAGRGRIGPDGKFYGLHGGKLVSWGLKELKDPKPVVLCEKAANDRDFSINDLAISSRGIVYFTTLKDPEKGRLSAYDPRTGKVTVLFDGEQEENLHNPNGIAIDDVERFLYVGISSYKNPGRAGVYCFPIREDGTIDVATGKQAAWLPAKADGIAVLQDPAGVDVFLTTEGKIECFDVYGRYRGHVKVPKGTGTNLCLGPSVHDKTIYFTTWDALYSVKVR
jgi:sugar lactone lactonase YvrE